MVCFYFYGRIFSVFLVFKWMDGTMMEPWKFDIIINGIDMD